MFNFKKRNIKSAKGVRKKKIPWFGIILAACFIIVPAVLFIIGLKQAPGRLTPSQSPAASGDEIDATPTPDATLTIPEKTPMPMPPAVKVKGIYYIVEFATNTNLERCIEFIESTDVNAIVIDVKDDYGAFTFATDNEVLSKASNAYVNNAGGIRLTADTIADLKERGIYTIARIVCFKDNPYAIENPSLALQNKNGGVWLFGVGNNSRWLNPYERENWEYILEACKEAAAIGFDEIQLDYVRFPSEGRLSDIDYGEAAEEQNRYQIINEFVSFIREEMRWLGVRTSADIFGIVGMSYLDASAVGQNVQLLLRNLDSVCPMIYPSHFAHSGTGYMGNGAGSNINGVLFERPDTEPHGVVYNVLQHYKRQVEQFKVENPGVIPAVVRPYLQYFTADYLPDEYWIHYGPEEMHAQIQAVHDAGFDEWILWVRSNSFDPAVIP